MEEHVLSYRTVDSTNNEANRFIAEGNSGVSFYVVADYQDHGRGQAGNRWVSDSSENLLMSWVVFPAFLSVSSQFQLSKSVSLAIRDLLAAYNITAMIKWPNDIVTPSGKIAGILIEHSILGKSIGHSVIGIGLNVNQQKFPDFPNPATSMAMETGKSFELSEIFEAMTHHLNKWYGLLESGEGDRIDEHYLQSMFMINKHARFSDGSSAFTGMIRGVSHFGELIIEREHQTINYGFHQIKMIF